MIQYGMKMQESETSAADKNYITFWIPDNKSTGGGYHLMIIKGGMYVER
jgi:hypothetical protein